MLKLGRLFVAASLAALSTPASAGFMVTYEAPGATRSSAGFDYFGVETFNDRLGQSDFTSNFTHGDTTISLTYSNVTIRSGDRYGGDYEGGNPSPYAVVGLNSNDRAYSIDIATNAGTGINYFGYWLTALDANNFVSFWSNGEKVFEFEPGDVLALLGGQSGYWGNPFTGQNGGEPYVFLNFFYETGTFDRVVFSQGPGTAGYESDNHTLGFYNNTSGTPVNPVPEPAAIGLLGAGLLGLAAIRRRR